MVQLGGLHRPSRSPDQECDLRHNLDRILCRQGSPSRRSRTISVRLCAPGIDLGRTFFGKIMSPSGTKRTSGMSVQCPLMGAKQTSHRKTATSVYDPGRVDTLYKISPSNLAESLVNSFKPHCMFTKKLPLSNDKFSYSQFSCKRRKLD